MRVLLDTHVWLWIRLDPARLGERLASELSNRDNELWISPISLWETMRLVQRGRVEVTGDAEKWIRNALLTGPLRDAPLTRDVALLSRTIDLDHDDPADRFIAASAVVHGLTLATADEQLLGSDRYDTIANR